MKVKEAIQRIQSLYSKGAQSDDSRLSSRHIYSVLLSVRNFLMVQQIKKKQIVGDWNYTILDCIEVIEVPAISCSCFEMLSCPVYRTKYRLPRILTDMNKHLIEFVITVDNGKIIDPTSRKEALYQKGNKYASGGYVIEDGYLFFTTRAPSLLKVKFLAEDPIDARSYISACDDCPDCDACESILDKEFPADGDMMKILIELTAEKLLGIFTRMQEDKHNNSSDDSVPQRAPQRRQREDD